MIKYLKFLFAIVFSIALACTNDRPLPNGYENFPRSDKGSVQTTVLNMTDQASFWRTPKAGEHYRLMLGNYRDVESVLFLQFRDFSEIDTLAIDNIQSVSLMLTNIFANGTETEMNVTARKITREWIEDDDLYIWEWEQELVLGDSEITDFYDSAADPAAEFVVKAPDSLQIDYYPMDTNLLKQWIADTDNNYGLLLQANAMDMMSEFVASENNSNVPRLQVISSEYIQESDSTAIDTIYIEAYQDASVLKINNRQYDENTVVYDDNFSVDNLIGNRSYMKFDASEIPEDATIHHAELVLTVDAENTNVNDYFFPLVVKSVVAVGDDSLWAFESTKIDSLMSGAKATVSDGLDTIHFDLVEANTTLSKILQYWVWGLNPNLGLIMYSSEEGYNSTHVGFLNDGENAPYIKVTYSLPPGSRFSTNE